MRHNIQPVGALAKVLQEADQNTSSDANKFHAIKVSNADGQFDSKHESRMAAELLRLQAGGYIKDVRLDKRQLNYELRVNDVVVGRYTADASFVCVSAVPMTTAEGTVELKPGEFYLMDAKSPPTKKKPDYVLRKNLIFALYGWKILEL